ncbi:MAG: DUF927 domain-containing protein [Sporomusaceae bacterium]|nr:DUF927 domain-containing protein [Sporomusaceae bacterium]
MDAITFLKTIYENADSGFTEIFTLPAAAAQSVPIENLTMPSVPFDQNIYFTPGITTNAINKKPGDDDIIGIPALWIDIDILDKDAHAKENLPKSVEEAYTILPELRPSLVVHSGYGIHAWWIFRECWYFDNPEEKVAAKNLLTRLQAYVRQRATAAGWHLDATFDLSRVMRLPGTVNFKIPQRAVMSSVIDQCENRYNPSDFEDILPEVVMQPERKNRTAAFERRPTDGPAEYMLSNCMFLQHCQLNAKSISYDEWLAALTNIVRATDGEQAAHQLSAMDPERYNQADTDKKIDEAIAAMNPQSCEYIKASLGFQGCPASGCGMKAPAGWSLGTLPQAKAKIKKIAVPSPESVYNPETLGALAILQKQSPADYDAFYQRCKGQLNLNTFRHELAQQKRESAGFTVIDGGGQEDAEGQMLSGTVQDVPIDLRLPAASSNYFMWLFNQNGVSMKKITDRGEQITKVSYVPVLITERIYNIDSGQEKAVVAFKTHRGQWRQVVLPKSTVFDSKKVMCLTDSGLTINSEMARGLTKWLSALEATNAEKIPDKTGVAKLGWRDKNSKFILPGTNSGYTLDVGDPALESAVAGFESKGDFGTWIEAMRQLRTHQKARFILAAAFAAPLLKIVGQRIFLIYNWGTTADGKSAALYAALSAWGDPDALKQTFNQTSTFVERIAELFTDMPIGINEYEVLTDKKKGEQDNLTYMLAEGKGRGRARKEGLQKTASWRTIAICNGETPFVRGNSRGGVVTRVIEFHGGPLANAKNFASDLYRVTAQNHGHAGKLFIEMLLGANHDEIRDLYNKTRYALREKYPDKLDAHMDAMACVCVADYLVSQWIFAEDKQAAIVGSLAVCDTIIELLAGKAEADESERAWAWLQDWIAANEGRFQAASDFNKKSSMPIIGYKDNGFLYIIKTEITNAIRAEGFSPEKVFRSWADKNRIPCSELGGKRSFGIRGKNINGVRPYVICLRMDTE